MKTLETQRLILRPFCPEDLKDMYEYAKDPDVGPSAGWSPHESIEETERILRGFIEKNEVWAIVRKQDAKVVGSIGLHPDRMRGYDGAKMLGYVLAKPCWGRGLMTEAVNRVIAFAFEEMNLKILSVIHYPFNARSKRVIAKCGFVFEGTLRRAAVLHDGSVCDACCYSIIKSEY